MLKPRKRLTRKQIKQDKFIITVMKVLRYVQRNAKWVVIGVVALLVVVLALAVTRQQKKSREIRSIEALGGAQMAKWAGQDEEALKLYQQITEEFGGTKSAGEAWVALGNLYFEQKQWEQAENAFKRYLKKYNDDPILTYTAWSGIAACLEEQGRYQQAAEKYQSFADQNHDSAWAAPALYNASRCFRLAGQLPQAKMALQRIIDSYPDLPLSSRAKNEQKLLD